MLLRFSRQSLLSLLSFRGRPRFRLPCLLSPFLLPEKWSVHTRKGHMSGWAAHAGLQPPPCPPSFQAQVPGKCPLRARSPHSVQPHSTLIPYTVLRAAHCSFPKPYCSFHSWCFQYHHQLGSIPNTDFCAQDPWLQSSPICHHPPLPTRIPTAQLPLPITLLSGEKQKHSTQGKRPFPPSQ